MINRPSHLQDAQDLTVVVVVRHSNNSHNNSNHWLPTNV